MNNVLVYAAAILFFIAVFPVHVFNYAYVSTEKNYASVNVTLYRLITIYNLNTDGKIKLKKNNDKKEKKKKKILSNVNVLRIYNNLCITKIVQLGDFGVQKQSNAYIAFTQKMLSDAIYAFVKVNGGKTKLKNYCILNYEHGEINYYLKLVGVINVITLIKLLTIFYLEKIKNEH